MVHHKVKRLFRHRNTRIESNSKRHAAPVTEGSIAKYSHNIVQSAILYSINKPNSYREGVVNERETNRKVIVDIRDSDTRIDSEVVT